MTYVYRTVLIIVFLLVSNKFVHLYSAAVLLRPFVRSGYLSLVRTLNPD